MEGRKLCAARMEPHMAGGQWVERSHTAPLKHRRNTQRDGAGACGEPESGQNDAEPAGPRRARYVRLPCDKRTVRS